MLEMNRGVWDHIPESGKLLMGLPFWRRLLGEMTLQSWLRQRVLVELTPEQLASSDRRMDLGDGDIEYQLERNAEGFRARDVLREAPTRVIKTDDPRAKYARFELNAFLREFSNANNITIRPDNPETGFSGVYKIGDSKIGKHVLFSWLLALNRGWLCTPAADSFLAEKVGEPSVRVLIIPNGTHLPEGFREKYSRVVVVELTSGLLQVDPTTYCRREFGLSFEDVRPLLTSTKKVVVDDQSKQIIIFDRPLRVVNSVSKKHEFLAALLTHGTSSGQNTIAFGEQHLHMNRNLQDISGTIRTYKSLLRKEFEEIFEDQPEILEEIDKSLLKAPNMTVACKIPRDSIAIW